MLNTQKFLIANGGDLSLLLEKFGIKVTKHEKLPLVILNYNQINSPKNHEICDECRGLILETGTWNVINRSFKRFYNYEEVETDFNWKDFKVQEKLDGSIMFLWNYRGEWYTSTRGSFGNLPIQNNIGKTWNDLFWESINKDYIKLLPKSYFTFELTSPYNQVVAFFNKTSLTLLSIFDDNHEFSDDLCDYFAKKLYVNRPEKFQFQNVDEIKQFLDKKKDESNFEGFVLKDNHNRRIKLKNIGYLLLHKLKNNDNIFNVDNLIPFILQGKSDDLIGQFPPHKEWIENIQEKVKLIIHELLHVWNEAKSIETQKEFAQFIINRSPVYAILFEARKKNVNPEDIIVNYPDLLSKVVKNGLGKLTNRSEANMSSEAT